MHERRETWERASAQRRTLWLTLGFGPNGFEALWLTRLSTVLTRQPRCCTSLWLMLPGHTWTGCTWRPVPMRHRSSSTGWTSTESAMT